MVLVVCLVWVLPCVCTPDIVRMSVLENGTHGGQHANRHHNHRNENSVGGTFVSYCIVMVHHTCMYDQILVGTHPYMYVCILYMYVCTHECELRERLSVIFNL